MLNARCWISYLSAALFLSIAGCGGGGNGVPDQSAALTQPRATLPATSSKNIGADGGVIGINGIAVLNVGKDVFQSPANLSIQAFQSADLDQEFDEANTGLRVIDSEDFHIRISGVPSNADVAKNLQLKLKVSDRIASQVGPTATLAVTAWQLDVSEEEEINESEMLPSQYDAANTTLTLDLPLSSFSNIDPLARSQTQDLHINIRVSLVPLNPQKQGAKTGMSAEAIMNQAIKAVPTPVIDPQDLCNPDWQSPLDNDFSVVGPFSETEGHANNHPHGGIDIAAKEKEVKAVTDGYIDEVKNMNRNSRDGPIYTLVQVSTQGDAIIYLHLTRGRSSPETDSRNGIQFCNKDANGRNTDCLADEPNILDHWKEKAKDPAKAKYKVKQGDVLAISGNTGAPNGTYHLHLEYLPIGNTHPQWKRNPLCRLAQLVAKPSTINLPAKNPGDDTTSLRLMDKTGSHEYLVRRQKHPKPEVFLSSAASPMPPETDKCKLTTPLLMCFDFLSRTVMVLTSQRTIADPSIASIDATYKDPGETRISTDNGKVHLLPGNNTGSTILKVKPEIIWNAARSGNDVVSLGSDVTVQINNALPPVPASPAPTPADKDCVVTDNGLLTKPNQSPVVGLTVQMVKNSAGCSLPLAPNGIGMPPNPANLPSLQPVAQVPFHPFKDPTHGSISIVNGHFFYKPDQDYVGTDSFTLNYTQVTADGHGQVGPDQQVQVTISP